MCLHIRGCFEKTKIKIGDCDYNNCIVDLILIKNLD